MDAVQDAPRVFECPECGARTTVRGKQAREHARDGSRPACAVCRLRARVVVTPELRLWWLLRFSLDEIRELAEPLEEIWRLLGPISVHAKSPNALEVPDEAKRLDRRGRGEIPASKPDLATSVHGSPPSRVA